MRLYENPRLQEVYDRAMKHELPEGRTPVPCLRALWDGYHRQPLNPVFSQVDEVWYQAGADRREAEDAARRSEPRVGEPYVIGGVVRSRPCGCTVDGRGTLPDPLRVEPCEAHAALPTAEAAIQESDLAKPTGDALRELVEAATPFAQGTATLSDRICHRGICSPEECGECGRIIRLRNAIAAATPAEPVRLFMGPVSVAAQAAQRQTEEADQVEETLAQLDDSDRSCVLILMCPGLPFADLRGRFSELGLVNERGLLTELGRACARRILEDDPEATGR